MPAGGTSINTPGYAHIEVAVAGGTRTGVLVEQSKADCEDETWEGDERTWPAGARRTWWNSSTKKWVKDVA